MIFIRQCLLGLGLCMLVSHSYADITVGMSAGFSGFRGQDNLAYRYGVETAFSQTNEAGGVKGEIIKLEALDDEFSADLAGQNALRFTNRKNVLAMLGGGENTSDVLSNVADQKEILFLGGVSTPPKMFQDYDNVLTVRPPMSEETTYMCRQFVDRGVSKVTVAYPEYSVMYAELKRSCEPLGVVLDAVSYPISSMSYSKPVQQLFELANENVVMLGDSKTINLLLARLGGDFYGAKTVWLASDVDPDLVKQNQLDTLELKVLSFLGSQLKQTQAYKAYSENLAKLNPYLMPSLRGLEGYVTALILVRGLEDVINPFDLKSPSDVIKLPLNVMRRFTGWVQEGKDIEQQRQLVIALSVMENLNVGLRSYPGFVDGNQSMNWVFSVEDY